MQAEDALLFIDANKYLDLYRTDKGKKLLAPLAEQVDHIFVTQQVVDEVQRNKILVASQFLSQKFKELRLQTFNVPDHLSGTNVGQSEGILQQMREIAQKIKSTETDAIALVLGIMDQISRSADEVSTALNPIFAKAIPHSAEELQRARFRKELGNPPGKFANPIGDQLTWEQILTQFTAKKRLWIISRDGDYGTVYAGKGFLNRFLYDELCKQGSPPEVYLFEDLVEGISHFVQTTGVKAEKQLTIEEAQEIEKEEKSLSSLDQPSDELRRTLARFAQLSQPERAMAELARPMDEFRRTLATFPQPDDGIRRAIAEAAELARPMDEFRRTLATFPQPDDGIRRAIAEAAELARPMDEFRRTLATFSRPDDSIRRAVAEAAELARPMDDLRKTLATFSQPDDSIRRAIAEAAELARPMDDLRTTLSGLYQPPTSTNQSQNENLD